MCERARIALPALASSTRAARLFAGSLCDGWQLTGLREDVTLIVSELVTNAVVHAATPVTLTLTLAEETLEIAVSDDSTSPPIVRPVRKDLLSDVDTANARARRDPPDVHGERVGAAGDITHGRGMLIVAALGQDWGVQLHDTGKHVWLHVPVLGRHGACPCPGSAATTIAGRAFRERTS